MGRLLKGIYNAFGVFSVIYWFGYVIAVFTNRNNFIVTAIGLGQLYLALLCFLHAGLLHGMETHKDDENQSSNLLANDQMDDNATNNSQAIPLDEEKHDAVIENNDNQNSAIGNNEQFSWRSVRDSSMIRRWTYLFVACGIVLVLLGISYAVAYSQNQGDFEFPEVHPFFLFTIFAFFALLQSMFVKYTWISRR